MTSILEHYKVLGVTFGAGIADITSSYKQLCRTYHPDLNDDPESEEQMKRINIAYAVLREKFVRDASVRERQTYSRPVKRYAAPDARGRGADADTRGEGAEAGDENAKQRAENAEQRAENAKQRAENAEAEKEAFSVINDYFMLINVCDYSGAYDRLSSYDKRHITRESFIQWRKSVARLYPLRDFEVTGGLQAASVTLKDGRTFNARRFHVAVTEENYAGDPARQDSLEKLVIREYSSWKVFLGYKGVSGLIRSFDERYENKRKQDAAKRWEEYCSGLSAEYNMLNLSGMRKAALHEIYRQRRFGGALSFAAISIKAGGQAETGLEELLRSSAKTITGALRETDVPAYIGDGVFAIMFVGLHKKNIDEIVGRLAGNIRKNAGVRLGGQADIEYAFESWPGYSPADIDGLNRVLKKFLKKV